MFLSKNTGLGIRIRGRVNNTQLSRHLPAQSKTIETLERSMKISSKLIIKISERRHRRCSGVFIVCFGYISDLVLVFLLFSLNM